MTQVTQVSPRRLFAVFGRIGLVSFGGPAGQIALMHRVLVDERGWMREDEYLSALNFCHLLPGPEAMQLATYAGWRLDGVRGGLIAGLLFVLPGAAVILALSVLYAYAADLAAVEAVFFGVKAAVLAIIAQALVRIGSRALDTGFRRALAAGAFIAIFFFDALFPLVVLGAGALGMLAARWRPEWLALKPSSPGPETGTGRPLARALGSVAVWGGVWAAPVLLILIALGPDHVLFEIAAFFSRLAVVTFGGAYAVLAWMAQEAVEVHGWLNPGEMADGLGLAETTPGPLILVTQFVGFLGAFRAPEPFSPLVAGVLGAAITSWVTFAPCFLWIFTLAPWVERIQRSAVLKGALSALTAAVVGVIASLAAWFALHVLFGAVGRESLGPLRLHAPDWASFDPYAALLAVLALIAVFVFRLGIIPLLGLAALAGLALTFAGLR
ncbi:chromate efflux transporter [Glycocaulis profundi]|nr:chromate efflux transporter [Glycocaulis profundi]